MKYPRRSVSVIVWLSLSVLLSGCLDFVSIDQPECILPDSVFTVHIEVRTDGGPAPSFAVCLPQGWIVVDEKITCTGGYTDDILYDPNLALELEPAPEGYTWWTGKGDPNGTSARGTSYGQLEIQARGRTGQFFLDYVIWCELGSDRSDNHFIAVVDEYTPRHLKTSVEGEDVSLSWTAPHTIEGLVGYHVYRNGQRLSEHPLVDPAFTDRHVGPGVSYYAASSLYQSGAEHTLPYEVKALVFFGGTGSPVDPYQISLGEQLVTLAEYPDLLDRHFVLKNDISLDPNLFGGTVFNRAVIPVLSGTLDGDDFTLSHLTIEGEDPSDQWSMINDFDRLGLFGTVESGAEVKNLTLVDVNIVGLGAMTGALAGENYGHLTSCHVEGTISGNSSVGGLAGINHGRVVSCHNACTITGKDGVGGLIGRNERDASVSKSHNTGGITGESDVGGLVGSNGHEATVSDSFSIGSVDGDRNVGGLVGENMGNVVRSYSTGPVLGAEYVGGLVGNSQDDGATIHSYSTGPVAGQKNVGGLVGHNDGHVIGCYSIGGVSGQENVGGLVGRNRSRSQTHASFWNVETSGLSNSPGGYGLTSDQMDDIVRFQKAGWDFAGQVYDGLHEIWQMSDGQGPPDLAVFNGYEPLQLQGLGTADAPYLISNAHELGAVHYHDKDAHYCLVSDIDLSGIHWGTAVIPSFDGTFDGKGHVISHLHVEGNLYMGLVGQLGPGARIANVGLEAVDINGEDFVGGLVGENKGGMINTSYTNGYVAGGEYVGGLVGSNKEGHIYDFYMSDTQGRVSICYSTAAVTGNRKIGGLVGHNAGVIDTTFSTGPATGKWDVGGLVGDNVANVIRHSYSVGTVSGQTNVGGLVGSGWSELIKGCFWNTETSGQMASSAGIGLATTKMQNLDTFTKAGWDTVDESQNGTCDHWFVTRGNYPQLTFLSDHALRVPQGLGTAQQPYLIRDMRDLGTVWRAPASHYRLEASIGLSGINWSRAVVPWFDGTFDGNGHSIGHLQMQGTGNLGLFGRLGSDAEILNLGLEDVDVNGVGDLVGGLAGENHGTITACHISGTIAGNRRTGGLVGVNLGFIMSSHGIGTVRGSSEVGGLVGHNVGQIDRSASDNSVEGHGETGGLVGINNGLITESFSTNMVIGVWDVGGLTGENYGDVSNCYSTSAVAGETQAGGLVGLNQGNIFTSCSRGLVIGDYALGGLVGSDVVCWGHGESCDYGYTTSSFWDIEASNQTESDGGSGKTKMEMQTATTFLDAGWDFIDQVGNGTDDIWWIDEGQDHPRLWWERIQLDGETVGQ